MHVEYQNYSTWQQITALNKQEARFLKKQNKRHSKSEVLSYNDVACTGLDVKSRIQNLNQTRLEKTDMSCDLK